MSLHINVSCGRRLAGLALALFVAGCVGVGAVDDGDIEGEGGVGEEGVQERSTVTGRIDSQLPGVVRVRSNQLTAEGALDAIAEADVASDGRYAVDVPASTRKIIVEGLDASGQAVGSVVVESTARVEASVLAAPISAETTVEAQVFTAMMATTGISIAEANSIDLRSRIDASLAAAIQASADAPGAIQALAEATVAAQLTEVRAYAAAGLSITQEELFDQELPVAAALNASLDAGVDGSADLVGDLDAIVSTVGLNARTRMMAEASANLVFREMIKERLEVTATGNAEVLTAAIRGAALVQSKVMGRSMVSTLQTAGVSQATIDKAAAATQKLDADLTNATTMAAVIDAVAEFSASLTGSLDVAVDVSLLGGLINFSASASVQVDAAISAGVSLSAELLGKVRDLIDAVLGALTGGAVDLDAILGLVDGILELMGDFDLAVSAQVGAEFSALGLIDVSVSAAVDVVVMANLFLGI